jgi:hypothetical protein
MNPEEVVKISGLLEKIYPEQAEGIARLIV